MCFPFNKLWHFQICIAKCPYSYKKQFTKNTFHKCQNCTSNCTQVPFKLQKNRVRTHWKEVRTNFFLNVYTGNNQVRLMIEKCNSAHAQNHRRARQAHMKKIVLNEDAFTQCFWTAKGVRSCCFFSVFFGLAMAPKLEKSESGSISWKHGTEGLRSKNIWSIPIFLWVQTHFFCSINGASVSYKPKITSSPTD